MSFFNKIKLNNNIKVFNSLVAKRRSSYTGYSATMTDKTPISNNLNNRYRQNQAGKIYKKDGSVGEINVDLKQGSEAPLGYIGKREFPDWYKPYLSNYNGHGYLICAFAVFTALCYVQYKTTLNNHGRDEIVTYRDEHTLVNSAFGGRRVFLNIINENEKIPMFNYVRRYMKESGF